MRYALLAVAGFGLASCGPSPEKISSANGSPTTTNEDLQKAQTAIATEMGNAERAADISDCKTNGSKKLSEYRRLLDARDYWSATLAIRRCAEVTKDPKLTALVAAAEVKSYVSDIESKQTSDDNRLRSMESLSRDYPSQAKKYETRLKDLQAKAAAKSTEIERLRSPTLAPDPEREACARAIMSSIGTNTTNYSDKMAYKAHVRENCKGFNLPQ